MLIDFTEIPPSNGNAHEQDIFEKFAREFLKSIGYEIEIDPARGADGGKDLKVSEIINGEKFFWLVSCKHKAHSGASVTKSVETELLWRITEHGCNGFIGFYSTIANQSLLNSLERLKNKYSYRLFDNEKIEREIVGIYTQETLFLRFFPKSYKKWKELFYYTEPVTLFEKYLDSEYQYDCHVNAYRKIFGSTARLIKTFRNTNNIELALKQTNITYLVIPEFETVMDDLGHLPFIEVHDVSVPNLLKEKYSIDVTRRFDLFAWYPGEQSIRYVLTPNYFLVSPATAEQLATIFQDLKSKLI